MQRILTSAVLIGLLIGTAVAFGITEKLKLEKSPVFGTLISSRIAPRCGCATAAARIRFKLRHSDSLSVTVLDSAHRRVDAVAASKPVHAGINVFHWNGRTDEGKLAPDGSYYVELHLERQHRTLLLPNQLVLDTIAPRVESAEAQRSSFSPDGDHQADSVAIRYRLSEQGFVYAYVGGHRIVRGRFHRPVGVFSWAGTLGSRRLPPGTYVVSVGAVDLAGNGTPAGERARVRVTLRYIRLASHRLSVPPGGTVAIGVSTDAKRYGWRLGSRHGAGHGTVLKIVAPIVPGRYRLLVTEQGHSDHAFVVVR
jgi:hypothetical protein